MWNGVGVPRSALWEPQMQSVFSCWDDEARTEEGHEWAATREGS